MTQCSTDIELLPCPFCGSQPVTERTGFSLRAIYIYCINDNGCPRPKAIGETKEKAIENWNLRAQPATPTAGGDEAAREQEPTAWQARWPGEDWEPVIEPTPDRLMRVRNSGRETRPLYLGVAQPAAATCSVLIEALRNCGCPGDRRDTVGKCQDAGTPAMSIRMIEKDGDDGQKLRNRAGAYDPLTRAYLKVLGFEPAAQTTGMGETQTSSEVT